MVKPPYLLVCLFFFSLSFGVESAIVGNGRIESNAMVPVGVVLDLNSKVGEMAEICISMALSDFYDAYPNYKTRLVLHKRDSKGDVVGAASAALDLLKNVEVQALLGPQSSAEAKFVTHLGEKAHVPILSFSATSPSLSHTKSPYFVRTTLNDSSQVKAIAAIVEAYEWREVVPIYEDTDYGNGIIPYLIDAFQGMDTRVPYRSVIPPFADDLQILEELNKLKTMQTRVFVVHMTPSLGSRLFIHANEAGMMSDGYAWIITDGLSMILDPMNHSTIESLQGVLGIQPYIPKSKRLQDFNMRLKREILLKKPNSKTNELNLFGIWAYDTIWALAMAVERVKGMNSRFLKSKNGKNSTDLATLGFSEMGPRLIKTILSTRFKGLSGEFHLVEGQLQYSAFQIFNVIGKGERVIGYWTPKTGLSRGLAVADNMAYSTSRGKLKNPIWPGDSTTRPKGWEIPIKEKKLMIGVPVKKGFREFMKVEQDTYTNEKTFGGVSIDVFCAVLERLPFAIPHEFIPYMNPDGSSAGSYDELLYQVHLQKFDAVVGDTTIVANRSLYVDFTLPYSESGVSMVVPIKDDESKNAWIFLKPLSWDLWLTTAAAFIFTGVVVWILEHRLNTEFRGPRGQQLGMILWFSFSTLVFAHREKVVNNLSRFVLIIWVFVVLILTQSYTASLTSMLTVQRLQPTLTDVKELKENGYYVGYQKDSFVKGLLTKRLNLNDNMLRNYSTAEEYHEALSKGSRNGGVAAIIDEIPYIKLFLTKYGSKYTMVGPTYKTDGFGFAFPLNSPLVPHFSRAILNLTEGDEMEKIEERNFKHQISYQDEVTKTTSNSLSIDSFWGLFLITGTASVLSLLIYLFFFLHENWHVLETVNSENSLWERLVAVAKHFDTKDLSSHPFKRAESKVHPLTPVGGIEASPSVDPQRPSRIFNQTTQNISPEEEHKRDEETRSP